MSRSRKGQKPLGYDYWSPRPGNSTKGNSPGPGVKNRTVRKERRVEKKIIEQDIKISE